MNVVIATDGSPAAAAAVAWAARSLDPAPTTAYVVSACPLTALLMPSTPGVYLAEEVIDELQAGARETARKALDDARAVLEPAGIQASYLTREGEPHLVIADVARGVGADMIVAGRSGKGMVTRLLEGSVSEALLHEVPGALVLIHPSSVAPGSGRDHEAAAPETLPGP